MDNQERALRAAATKAGLGINEYVGRLDAGLKYCWRCQDWHPGSAFARDANRGDGLRAACRDSINAAARKPAVQTLRPFPDREWRAAVGYEGSYDVSDKGDVWSLPRGGKAGRMLKQQRDRRGYLNVGLCRGGSQKTILVHRLVMEAFVGPCPPELETRHLDGDAGNNTWPENLVYGTPSENAEDKVLHGTATRGELNGRHKLTAADVREMHRRRLGGESKRSLSRSFGVAPPMVRRILAGTAWQDVHREFPVAAQAAAS
jgi:hypothetical protein